MHQNGTKIDLLLVNPGNRQQTYSQLASEFSGIEPPIWCGLHAAFIRQKGYSVKIIDADAEDLDPIQVVCQIIKNSPLLVEIIVLGTNPSASSTPKMAVVREILNGLREKAPHIKTILSGLHPSALPRQTLEEEKTDFVCQGEGFYTILNLLEAFKKGKQLFDSIPGLWFRQNGKIISNSCAPLINADDLSFVAWELLPMDKYRAHNWHCFGNLKQRSPYAAIYTSLGCPFTCSYCNIHALYNNKPSIRYRSPENVVEEIGLLSKKYKIRNIKIADELFVINEERVDKICDLIIEKKYDLNMWAYARVDIINEKILKKMKMAGINWLCFGIESASEQVRKGVSKMIAQDEIKKAIEMTKRAGIHTLGNFIFGLPDDNLETMRETLNLAKDLNCEYVNFYVAMAYPGSNLYEEVIKNDFLDLPKTWDGYAQLGYKTTPLSTKYLSARDVLFFRDRAFEEYFNNPRYIESIRNIFGESTVNHIKEMLKHKIKRRLLEEDEYI